MELKELRDEIDTIDAEMVALFEKRMRISEQVAAYKIENGLRVFDKMREKSKLSSLSAMASNDFNRHGILELYEQIMSMSRKLQYQLLSRDGISGRLSFISQKELDITGAHAVYQGAPGSYSQEAMRCFFGDNISSSHVNTFRECMEAIEDGSADFAVLPIDNSTAGAVNQVYELLVEFENYIVAEQVISVRHALVGLPGSDISQIKRVYSHPQALMQSARYLSEHPDMEQISISNTAVAAKKVLEDNNISEAAIASEYAAHIYGLKVLEAGINQNEGNSTRFIVVTNQKVFLERADKISICFEVPHSSGSLYRILSHFIYNDLNMTKIESQPMEDRTWEYRFFVDFEGNLADASVKNAIRGLREEARNLKILGNYENKT